MRAILLITALMPMEEYVAGVLAGEVGNFKSDEALKAMAVAARTYALHFGAATRWRALTSATPPIVRTCASPGIDAHLRRIADSTAGEVLWYDGEPAAAYYSANCGGTTEDGRFILGNDEERAPFLKQHSDQYCVRNGGTQWRTEVSKRELQRALAADGVNLPGTLRAVSIVQRTPSGRVEFLRLTGGGRPHRSGAGLSLRHRPPHRMGPPEEQLVYGQRRGDGSGLSRARLGTWRRVVPGGRGDHGRGRPLLPRDPRLLLPGDQAWRQRTGNAVAAIGQRRR